MVHANIYLKSYYCYKMSTNDNNKTNCLYIFLHKGGRDSNAHMHGTSNGRENSADRCSNASAGSSSVRRTISPRPEILRYY